MFNFRNKQLTKSNAAQKLSEGMGTYVILAISLFAMAFVGVCTPTGPDSGIKGAAGSVAGEQITKDDFARFYGYYAQAMRQRYGADYDPVSLQVAKTVLDLLIMERVMYRKAVVDLGVRASDDEIVERMQGVPQFLKDGEFSKEAFRAHLRNQRYSGDAFMEAQRREMTVQRLRNWVARAVHVTEAEARQRFAIKNTKLNVEYVKFNAWQMKTTFSDEQVKEFLAAGDAEDKIKSWYDSHISDYRKPEKASTQHVLVAYDKARNAAGAGLKRSKDEAKELADKVYSELVGGAIDFDAAARKYSDEPGVKKSGGRLGLLDREALVAEYADAAFALADGAMSKVVESPFGFHIIKMHNKQSAQDIQLADARDEIIQKILRRDKGADVVRDIAQKALADLQQGRPVDDLLKKHQLKWETIKDVALDARYLSGLGSHQQVLKATFSLTKGQIYNEPVKVGDSFIVIKMADVKAAPVPSQDDLADLIAEMNSQRGDLHFRAFEKTVRKQFEDKGLIERNEDYLNLDQSSV